MGYDVYASLPLLSAFIGHKNLKSTEHYIRLTNQMYPEIFKTESHITTPIRNVITSVIVVKDNEE